MRPQPAAFALLTLVLTALSCSQTAQQLLQAAAEAVGLRLKPLDKKAEKALVQAQQDDLQSQLADQSDPAAVLSLVVPLLVMQVRECYGWRPCCVLVVLPTLL